jgi:hypothetical protein
VSRGDFEHPCAEHVVEAIGDLAVPFVGGPLVSNCRCGGRVPSRDITSLSVAPFCVASVPAV